MSTSAILAVSSDSQHISNYATIQERLLEKYPTISAQGWGLNFRALRSTSVKLDGTASPDCHFILKASHLGEDTFLAIEKGDTFSNISISAADTDAYVKLLAEKFNMLWTTKATYSVTNGGAYELDDVTIRLGELRLAGSAQQVRGILCFVSLFHSQGASADTVLADLIKLLGFSETRRFNRTWDANNRRDEIKLWCDALNP